MSFLHVPLSMLIYPRLKAAVETFVQDEPIALVFPPPELCTGASCPPCSQAGGGRLTWSPQTTQR